MSHEGPLLFMEGVGLARNEVGGSRSIQETRRGGHHETRKQMWGAT